jgi:colicin import membrane protein
MADQVTSTDLIIKLPAVMTAETFTNEEEFERLYSQVKEAVDKHVPDISTKTGRDAIASLAYKVARTKTALIGQGKKLTEDWRDKTKKVNAACNLIEERLDNLRDDVRKPLNVWEEAEKARQDRITAVFAEISGMKQFSIEDTSVEINLRREQMLSWGFSQADFLDRYDEVIRLRDDVAAELMDVVGRLRREEADRAELAKLRAEAAERERLEAERLAAEQAKQAEADRVKREQEAEEKRKAELARAAEEAAARAEQDAAARVAAAEQAAKDAAEKAERDAAARVAAAEQEATDAKARAEQAIADAKAKAERDAEEEHRRVAAAQEAEAEEQRRRDKNKAHRKTVNNAIVAELVECSGITAEQAQAIVGHLVRGLVPNVTLQY